MSLFTKKKHMQLLKKLFKKNRKYKTIVLESGKKLDLTREELEEFWTKLERPFERKLNSKEIYKIYKIIIK